MKKKGKVFIAGILGIVLLFGGIIGLLIQNTSKGTLVPSNFEERQITYGETESKYVPKGSYEVSSEDKDSLEIWLPVSSSKVPCIIFLNGTGAKAEHYSPLFRHIASYGYAVIGNNYTDAIKAEEESLRLAREYSSKIDENKIVIAGHGEGAYRAIRAASASDAYAAAVCFSLYGKTIIESNGLEMYDLETLKCPVMMISGAEGIDEDSVLPEEEMKQLCGKIPADCTMIALKRSDSDYGETVWRGEPYALAWLSAVVQNDPDGRKAFYAEDAEILENPLWKVIARNEGEFHE
ncbi:MAG: hypothetical protein IIZ48_00295 [Erysipelotrichales bacterium]|nr:hypothetical protein [Erysipelotrichales bacterium]